MFSMDCSQCSTPLPAPTATDAAIGHQACPQCGADYALDVATRRSVLDAIFIPPAPKPAA